MPPAGYRDYVEAVRAAADIAQVVGEAVSLRKSGRSMVGLCPFHQERTPSFHVDPVKGLYYCFGCGAGGDAFKFVMNFHQVEFPEAVALLADRLGIPRPAPASAVEAHEDRQRRRALEALGAAQEYFVERLGGPEGESARTYLQRRAVSFEQAQRFGLGLAPAGWDNLLRRLSSRSFQVEDLMRAGLVAPRSGGEGVYDRFRARLTFPIRDTAGRVVSFGGRALTDETPKYLNGPETVVYDKSRTLFRLHETAQEIRQAGRATVVEGYFDAVSLAAVGAPGVVAVCGTALSASHARLLRRYAGAVVLLFDADAAGRSAVHRALDPLLAEGLSVHVATPPPGKDPDDIAREGGRDAVEACLGQTDDLPQFLVSEARRSYDLGVLEGRVKALEMVLGHLASLQSPMARAEAGARVAQGLGIEDGVFREELRRAARDRRRELGPEAVRSVTGRARRLSEAESQLVRFLGDSAPEYPEDADKLVETMPRDALGPLARDVFERWVEGRRSGAWLTLRQLAELAPSDAAADILALAFAPGPPPDPMAARGAVSALREARLRIRLRHVQEQIERARDPGEQDELIREKFAIAQEIRELAVDGLSEAAGQAPTGGSS